MAKKTKQKTEAILLTNSIKTLNMVHIKKKILKIKAKFKKILFNILKTNPDETRTLLYQS